MAKNLAQLGVQLLAIWKQLGISQRITVVGAASIVLCALLGLAFWSSHKDYALLYGRLDDGEAAKVAAALDEAKISYKTGGGGGSIYVPADKVHQVRMQLISKGIPKGEGVGFEIFDKPNFGLSDFVQRANYVRAMQGELGRTIGQLDEVVSARVMIVMPENRLLTDNQKKPTASVFIKVKGNTPMGSQAVSSIQFLVANSVEGLQANSVTVVDNHGNVLSENHEADSLVGLSSNQLALRQKYEQYFSRKAEDILTRVLGPGQAIVRVSVDINYDTKNLIEEVYDPDKQVLRNSTIEDEKIDTSTSASGGVAGISANTMTETNSASSPSNNNKTTRKTTTTTYDNSRVTSTTQQAPGTVKRITAAVFVASKIEGVGEEEKVVPRTEDELKKLRNVIQSALGVQMANDGGRLDELTLEEMRFNDQFAVEISKKLDQQQTHEFVWNIVRTMMYPVIAMAIIFSFWRNFKKTHIDSIPIGIPLGQLSHNGNGNGNGKNGNGHSDLSEQQEPGVVTVDVLNRLVKENPDNMNQAIRTWLNRSKPATK